MTSKINSNEFIINEKIDLKNAYKILNSDLIDDEHKNKLQKYLKYSDNGIVKVKYIKNDIGRLNIKLYNKKKLEDFDKETCTVQSFMKRIIKGAICEKNYKDIDVNNAHPTFILNLFDKLGYDTNYLNLYVRDRDIYFDLFSKLKVSRDASKELLLKVMYGGGFSLWCKKYNCIQDNIPNIFFKLKDEINSNTIKLLNLKEYEKFSDYAIEKKGKSYFNLNGAALSYVAQTIECNVLLLMKEFYENEGFVVGALIHDGLHIEKSDILNKSTLIKCSNFIYDKTNIKVILSFKDFIVDEKLNNIKIVQDQKEAADFVSQQMKKELINCNETYFIKHKGIWSMNPKTIKRLLQDKIPEFNILTPALQAFLSCNRNTKSINEIAQLVRGEEDDDFLNKLFFSNLKKICFENGYYDFTKGVFIKGFDDIMTMKKIHRGFPKRIQKDIDKLYEEILNPIFDDNIEFRNYFLYYIARGLAGHIEDKAWAVGSGCRNSGKGVIGDLCKNSFGAYVSTTNSENFTMKAGQRSDEAKGLSWLIDFMDVRLMITNEISMDARGSVIINGNTIKKLSSGGDLMEARKNYQDEIKFRVQARPILFCNDLPEIEPKDALETMTKFEFPCQFVNDITKQNPLAKIKLADNTIKLKCNKEEYINAFIHIIIDNYSTEILPMPQCVKEFTDVATTDDNDDTEKILSIFNFTESESDFIKCIDLYKIVNLRHNIAASKQKIFKILQTKKVYKKNHTKQRVKYFFGLTLADDVDKAWLKK